MKLTESNLQRLRTSTSYKERMIAEYFDLDLKIKKMSVFIEKLVNKELSSTPKSKLVTFTNQYNGMVTYENALATRCRDEGIDLSQFEVISDDKVLQKYTVLLITGKSASGKDTLLRKIIDEYPVNKPIWKTTRPRRCSEIDGVDYHFVGECVGTSLLHRTFNNWTYALDMSELSKDGVNVIIASPSDVRELESMDNILTHTVCVEADDLVRIMRSLERTPRNSKEIVRRFQTDEVDFQGEYFDYRAPFDLCWEHVSKALDVEYTKVMN